MKFILLLLAVILSIPIALFGLGELTPNFGIDKGLPQPGSGVTIVSEKQNNLTLTPKMIRENNLRIQQQKLKGYSDSNSDAAIKLLNIGRHSKLMIDTKNKDPLDTHIKASLSQIKLAFK